jgi:starch-binding outer membrane protein, SusD/RagB family
MKIFKFSIYIFIGVTFLASCSKDFLEPEVTTSKDVETNVNTAEDLDGIILGAYDRMNAATYLGRDYIVYAEVRSDNAFSNGNSGRFVGPAQFFLNATDAYPSDTWLQIYRVIANANIVINTEVEDNESAAVQHLKGEAYAIRALAHMDLLRLYGEQYSGGTLGVPYITVYNSEELYPSRLTIDEVWNNIGADLEEAEAKMSSSYDSDSPTRITTLGVAALQSRYYLYTKNYTAVIEAAERVIESGAYSLADADTYTEIWSGSGGSTSVFELAFTSTDNLSNDAIYNIYQGASYGDIEVTTDLYDAYEDTDARKKLYTYNESTGKIRMTGKYPNLTANIRVIRYAEVVLNYAEALAQTGAGNALEVLNMIPSRRGASLYEEATVENVLAERRKELALEGHRFFDLVRNEKDILKVDSRQTFIGDKIPYGSTLLPFPIPQSEVNANPNIEQNDGY